LWPKLQTGEKSNGFKKENAEEKNPKELTAVAVGENVTFTPCL